MKDVIFEKTLALLFISHSLALSNLHSLFQITIMNLRRNFFLVSKKTVFGTFRLD